MARRDRRASTRPAQQRAVVVRKFKVNGRTYEAGDEAGGLSDSLVDHFLERGCIEMTEGVATTVTPTEPDTEEESDGDDLE